MNLFLVTSPFQYLCAVEAKKSYNTSGNILLLVEQPREPGISHLAHIYNESEWDHVIHVTRKQRSFSVPKAIKQAKKLNPSKKFQHFFHGEYNAWRTKLILKNLNINTEVYFDDGSLTLSEYDRHIKTHNSFYRPRLVNDMVIRLQGLSAIGKLPMSKNLQIFTMFNINAPIVHIVQNKFEALRQRYNLNVPSVFDDSLALFLGQGSIGCDGTKKDNYLDLIKRFAKKTGKPILYAPHRTENPEVRELVKTIPNLTYHDSSFPIEIEIAEKGLSITDIGGVSSTALFSLKLIYPNIRIYTADQTKDDYLNPISYDEILLMTQQLKDLQVELF
ncbi:polysialyltransferase family glycosyltransferase [Vibrio gallaecicus]|uniref:Polysialyltransferase family glycosyltransferase n=1 Tax=Vibrio gallaecicus TaxID=552386 RepID=A0ABV4NB70_9VIBR